MTENIELKPDAVLIVTNEITLEKYGSFTPGTYHFINYGSSPTSMGTFHFKTRAKPEPITHVEAGAVDLETLNAEAKDFVVRFNEKWWHNHNKMNVHLAICDWNNHLSQRGLLKSPEHIEGLEEAIEAEQIYLNSQCEDVASLIEFNSKFGRYPGEVTRQAARRYAAMMKDKP